MYLVKSFYPDLFKKSICMSLTQTIIGTFILIRHNKKRLKELLLSIYSQRKTPLFFFSIQIQSRLALPLLSQGKFEQKCDGWRKRKMSHSGEIFFFWRMDMKRYNDGCHHLPLSCVCLCVCVFVCVSFWETNASNSKIPSINTFLHFRQFIGLRLQPPTVSYKNTCYRLNSL